MIYDSTVLVILENIVVRSCVFLSVQITDTQEKEWARSNHL